MVLRKTNNKKQETNIKNATKIYIQRHNVFIK